MYVVPVVIISILLNAPKLFETVIVYEPVNTVDRYVISNSERLSAEINSRVLDADSDRRNTVTDSYGADCGFYVFPFIYT